MLIQLKNCEEVTGNAEWCILEFQGELLGDMQPGSNVGELLEIKVCPSSCIRNPSELIYIWLVLVFSSIMSQGSDIKMTIGQHILEGTISTLSKPFAIFESDGDCLDMKGVIRKKILFKIRPKPRGQVQSIL
jgi:hypothetical protein